MRATIRLALVVGVLLGLGLLPRDAETQDRARFLLASGTVGIAQGQTFRLSVANIGVRDVNVRASLLSNPTAVELVSDSFTLRPGETRDIDLPAADIPPEHFDRTRRAQVRASIGSSAPTALANLEVFDNETGRTSAIVSLEKVAPSTSP